MHSNFTDSLKLSTCQQLEKSIYMTIVLHAFAVYIQLKCVVVRVVVSIYTTALWCANYKKSHLPIQWF